jgi:general L-amino acid transport system substrate-binding protein
MYGTDRSGLASNRLSFDDPDRHMILPEIISKEPLGPVVKYGDQKWSDVIRWTIYVLFIAEEMGINSKNIDSFKNNIDPYIQRFMGEKNGKDYPHLGAKLGLSATWSYDIIKQIGNYKEIYERNVGENTPLGLQRGLNRLYNHGGLLYAPPLK